MISFPGVPVKPPVSGNSLFVQEYMVSEEAKYLLANERMKFAAQKWKELSEEERRKFNEQAKEVSNLFCSMNVLDKDVLF